MEQQYFESSIPSHKQIHQPSKKININLVIVSVFSLLFLIASNFGTYYWQYNLSKKALAQKESQLNVIETKLNETLKQLSLAENELDSLKNPPTPDYCEDGKIYENSLYGYRLCLPDDWIGNPNLTTENSVAFSKSGSTSNNYISVRTSTDFIEDALRKYTRNVFVDETNRDLVIDGLDAIQVSGTIQSNRKRAITVFTNNTITYEILLENSEDATYTGNLSDYKQIVNSFSLK